jgi:hypothetical protein
MKRMLFLAALLSTAGCVSARATMLGGTPQYPPVLETDVRVFLSEDQVPGSCVQYAIIHTSGAADLTDETDMIAAARRRAGKIGANGVLLGQVRDPSTGTRIASAVFGMPANRKGQLLAYRCDESGRTPAATSNSTTPANLLVFYMD